MGGWGRKSTAALLAAIVTMLAPVPATAVGSATRGYAVQNSGLVVLDPVTNTVSGQVPLGFRSALRVRPDGAEVYLTDASGGAIKVLNTATNTVVATIPVGGTPSRVAFTPDSRRAYTANDGLGAVQVIDTASRRVVQVIQIDPIGSWFRLYAPAVSPDGAKVYLGRDYGADLTTNEDVLVIRTATARVSAVIPLPDSLPPALVVFSHNGRLAMTTHGNVLDVGTDTFLRRITTGTRVARDFVFTADSTGVLLAEPCQGNPPAGVVQHVDVTTDTLLHSLLVGRLPVNVSLTPDRKHLYVNIDGGRNIAVVDTTTWAVEDQFGVADPATPPRMIALEVSGTTPPTRPGTRFALAAPNRAACAI